MKIQNVNYNTNFKGYKNIICHGINSDASKLFYMGMQLDNVDTPDLDIWRNIRKRLSPQSNMPEDIISFNIASVPRIEPVVCFNGIVLADSELLREDTFSQNDKKTNFQVYKLIASLTKRISNEDFFESNYSKGKVGAELYKTFMRIVQDDKKATYLLHQGISKKVSEQVVAGEINSIVHKIMRKALK